MSSYITELEAGIARLTADLESARNDTRLAEGALAMANANIDLLKGENATLRNGLRRITDLQHGVHAACEPHQTLYGPTVRAIAEAALTDAI